MTNLQIQVFKMTVKMAVWDSLCIDKGKESQEALSSKTEQGTS